MVSHHYAPLGACLNSRTAKTACHIDYTDEVCVSHERARYVCEDGPVSRTSGCTGDKGISGLLGQHIGCTSDACLGNICRRTPYHTGHKRSCPLLLQKDIVR